MKLKHPRVLGGLLFLGLAIFLAGNIPSISRADSDKATSVKEKHEAAPSEKEASVSSISPICNEVLKLHNKNKLKDVIASRQTSELQQIDIDNDGVQEQIKYFPTRTYMALTEMRGSQRVTIPMGTPTARYSGADIIRLNEKHYILQSVSSDAWELYELLELFEQDSSLGNPYTAKILCTFHQ